MALPSAPGSCLGYDLRPRRCCHHWMCPISVSSGINCDNLAEFLFKIHYKAEEIRKKNCIVFIVNKGIDRAK